MTPEIIDFLRLPGHGGPPRLEVFEALKGRVITGALVSADRSCWAPVRGGVVALCEAAAGLPPTSADDLAEDAIPQPLFAGHRDWISTADPALARVPFDGIADRLGAEVGKLAAGLEPGMAMVVTGDDSGWAACFVAGLLPDQAVIAVIDKAGPLGLAGCRRWLAASDAPTNLTAVVAEGGTQAFAADAAVIDVAALEPGEASAPPVDARPDALHALINPDAPIDLNRAQIGERLLSDAETKVLYWASRAVSVARTAERMECDAAEIIDILAKLHSEGFIRLQRLPAAMVRLHVFWSTGEAILPLAEQTLGHVAEFGFKAFAERVYIHNADDGSAMTYGEAAEVIKRTAAALHRDGVRRGDRVCVHAIPHIEVPLLFWACVHLGAVFVPIGSIWSGDVATSILDRCSPKALFINDEVKGRVPEKWRAKAVRLDPAGDTADPAAREILFSDWLDQTGASQQVPANHAGPDECVVILFTSGTTGVPKGVLLSNSAIVVVSLSGGRLVTMGAEDLSFTIVEPTSTSGLREICVCTVMSGCAAVISDPARRGNVLGLADICQAYGITVFRVVPATLRWLGQIKDRLAPGSFKALRVILSNASPLHQETLDAIAELGPTRVIDSMGSSEVQQTAVSNPVMKRGSIFVHGGYTQGNVAQTVDEAGEVIRDGGIGRLRVYSDRMMSGYLSDPERTAEVMQDGWAYTGDMARWELGGPLRIAGRAAEMIKSAWGDKVFPSEIETALMADKCVHEVAACGFVDSDKIERIVAFVAPSSTPKDPDRLIEDLKDRVRATLGDSRVPSVVVLVENMPRVGRDKINKRALVAMYLGR